MKSLSCNWGKDIQTSPSHPHPRSMIFREDVGKREKHLERLSQCLHFPSACSYMDILTPNFNLSHLCGNALEGLFILLFCFVFFLFGKQFFRGSADSRRIPESSVELSYSKAVPLRWLLGIHALSHLNGKCYLWLRAPKGILFREFYWIFLCFVFYFSYLARDVLRSKKAAGCFPLHPFLFSCGPWELGKAGAQGCWQDALSGFPARGWKRRARQREGDNPVVLKVVPHRELVGKFSLPHLEKAG